MKIPKFHSGKELIMDFEATKKEMMRRFKSIKNVYRNESKKGIYTTVILYCGAKSSIKLADGEQDDIEKSIPWAFAKATKDVIMSDKNTTIVRYTAQAISGEIITSCSATWDGRYVLPTISW